MAAWIGPHWLNQSGLGDGGEEASRRRLVDFLLGPAMAKKVGHFDQQLPDLLSGAAISSCSAQRDSTDCTHIELEAELQLPAGWEKCLNLKDGSIYYLNRATGAMSAVEPQKQAFLDKLRGGADAAVSPATSELTAEVIQDANSSSKSDMDLKPSKLALHNDVADGGLDLSLSLHVGGRPSCEVTAPVLASASANQKAFITAASAHVASSPTSSSSTSSPTNASLAFSQAILSSQQSFLQTRDLRSKDLNHVMRFAASESRSFCHDMQKAFFVSEAQTASADVGQKLSRAADTAVVSSAMMVTAACANCLMFVMLSKGNPRCPRCGCHCPEQMDFPGPPVKKPKLGHSF